MPAANMTEFSANRQFHQHPRSVEAVVDAKETLPTTSGGRSWPCRVCNLQLSSSGNRKRHERAKHPSSEAAILDGRFKRPDINRRVDESALTPPDQLTSVAKSNASSSDHNNCKQLHKRKHGVTLAGSYDSIQYIDASTESEEHESEPSSDTASCNKRQRVVTGLPKNMDKSATIDLTSESDEEAAGPELHTKADNRYDSHENASEADEDYSPYSDLNSSNSSQLSSSESDSSSSNSAESQIEDQSLENLDCGSNTPPSSPELRSSSPVDKGIELDSGLLMGGNTTHNHLPMPTIVRPTRDWTQLSQLPGAPPVLASSNFHDTCEPFITWLAQPPITQSEAMVKARRVRNPSQVLPIRNNLRFLLVTLHEQRFDQAPATGIPTPASSQLAAAGVPQLEAFTQLHVCQRLFDLLVKRQIGSARVHALFLLIKKVLVYLSSVASLEQRQYIAPVIFASYFYVDSVCADASLQRKQEARNRSLLGNSMQATPFQALHPQSRQHHEQYHNNSDREPPSPSQQRPAVSMPKVRLPDIPEDFNGDNHVSKSVPTKSTGQPHRPDDVRNQQTLTKEDLQKLATGCLAQLKECQENHSYLNYVKYLATATLCLGLAPRSQVLRELQLGTTLVKEKGRYWIKMLAELNKNGKPCMMAFPSELTQPYDYYFERVRPELLDNSSAAKRMGVNSVRQHAYVFFKRNGDAPRPEFSTWTAQVTTQLLGRPINAHAFRAGVITTFYENGASQSEMDVLASLMAHDSATAKLHYFKPQFAKAAVQTNEQMTRLLLPAPSTTAAMDTSDP